jgi:hypothetical protein
MTIRNDATRLRIVTKDKRHLRAVVARQGQVLLDTDFDQQSRHHLQRIETEALDSLGSPGRLVVPAGNTGFLVTPDGAPANFNIGAGRGYLNGWLLENPQTCKLGTQPHPRTGDAVNVPSIIALKALVRHIDPVEDPALADAALGDAQASGRSLVDWQVFPVATTAPLACANALSKPEWTSLAAPSSGTLAVIVQAAAPSTDPCSLTPGGGYTRLENLLYRLEVHGGVAKAGAPTIDGPRFGLGGLRVKFSRRNASVMVRITNITNTDITVTPPALDPRNWFAPGLFAEFVSIHDDVDPRSALANERLFRVASSTDDHVVLEGTAAQVAATGATLDGTWYLRLWDAFPDGSGRATATVSGGASESDEIDLGDGLKIKLGGGAAATFRRGDYWTCAARADGTVGWSTTGGVADLLPPDGPEIRYAPIAAFTAAGFEDCRIPFATLTDRALLYRGGDGQSVFAPTGATMVELPGKLRVAVMRGETPVVGATVRWSLVTGAPACLINGFACNAGASPEVATDANGLAEVAWSIDGAQKLAVHKVQAAIVTGASTSQPPLVFTATFDTAQHTGYTPGKCKHLVGVDNVQDALDTLCATMADKPRSISLTSIVLLNTKPAEINLVTGDIILNATEVAFDSFNGGIAFGFESGAPDIAIAEFDPVVEVEVDLPYPITDPDRAYWAQAAIPLNTAARIVPIPRPFGFQRVRLDGTVKLFDKGPENKAGGLLWTPSPVAASFINSVPNHLWGQRINPDFASKLRELGWLGTPLIDRILCRIRLRSAMIWMDDKKTGERVYLNAEHLGITRGTGRDLLLKDVDPQRAGDLDLFIYLMMPNAAIPVRPPRNVISVLDRINLPVIGPTG